MNWYPADGGYEATSNPELIELLLQELREKSIWVQFVSPDFRSGPTVLLEIKKDMLLFDLPRPWDPHLERARVIYKDTSKIIHSFRVDIIKTHHKFVYTSRPKKIYRLERRRFYRIKVPPSSKARFRWGKRQMCAEILDISGNGMAICLKGEEVLPRGTEISDIHLDLYLSASKPYPPLFIKRGRIARRQKRNRREFYGVEFFLNEKERQPLMRYILKREMELCRLKSSVA